MDADAQLLETPPEPTTADTKQAKRTIARVPPKRPPPSERFGFDVHLTVLTQFVLRTRGGAGFVDTEAIESIEGVKSQSASLNANFWVDIGLLTKEKRQYKPTEPCVETVRFLRVDENRAKATLRPVIANSWFGRVAQDFLNIAAKCSEDQLVTEFAAEAGVFDIKEKARGLRVMVEYLAYADLIVREEGEIRLNEANWPVSNSAPPAPEEAAVVSTALASQARAPVPAVVQQAPSSVRLATPAVAPAADPGWLHQSWPGLFDISVRVDPKAVRMLESVLGQLRLAIELRATDEETKPKGE